MKYINDYTRGVNILLDKITNGSLRETISTPPHIRRSVIPMGYWKEGSVLFNDALNTFYLRLYGVNHRDVNPVPTSPLANDITTAPSGSATETLDYGLTLSHMRVRL